MPEAADLTEHRSSAENPFQASAPEPCPGAGPPAASRPRADESYVNLTRYPGLLRRLPAMKTAFDGQAMRGRLQDALFGKENPTGVIEDCIPGKGFYFSEELCLLQYALKVNRDGRLSKLVVNARLFQDPSRCAAYFQDRLAPLVAQMLGRPEVQFVAATAAVLPELPMAVSVFPIDGQLPTLVAATDLQVMAPLIGSLQLDLTGAFAIQGIRIELAHYGRYERCVLRYRLDGQMEGPGELQSRLVYGKVAPGDAHLLTVAATDALMGWIQKSGSSPLFRIPRIYGYWPEMKLLLMEALPGDASFSGMLKARVRGEATPQLDTPLLEDAVKTAARVAAALHASGIRLGEERTFSDEIHTLREEVDRIEPVLPDVGGKLSAWLKQIEAYGAESPALPLRFSHGDFTYTQFIYHQGVTGLVDFDNICQAEPALDLGQFLAYLRFNIRKEELADEPFPPAAIDQLYAIFLNEYFEDSRDWLNDEAALRARIEIYELLSLIRLGIHSWQKLKGSRLKHVLNLLEERVPCLNQAR